MSATTQRPRKHQRDPDSPIPNRSISSMALVVEHARAALRVWHSGDDDETRDRLRQLSHEASLLAAQDQLSASLADRRLRIASEREPSGRGGSS